MFFCENQKLHVWLVVSFVIHGFIIFILPSESAIPINIVKDLLIVKINHNSTDSINDVVQPAQISTSKDLIQHQIKKSSNTPNTKKETVLLLPLEKPKYYKFQELDSRPIVLKDIDNSPELLLQHPEGGSLVLQLWIDENGNVSRVEVLQTDLSKEFSEQAIRDFLKLKFSPGLKDNQKVKSTVNITVKFNPLKN